VPPAAASFPPVVAPLPVDAQLTRAIPRPEVPVSHGSLLLPSGDRVAIGRGGLTIGRGQECDVRIADASVSRRHAAISVRGDRVVVEDLDSTNGTTVNGERVRSAELADGDRVTFGAATITYRS
jgi:pSer/pThr/pTyr-binding forkhead associated (FHA) protein